MSQDSVPRWFTEAISAPFQKRSAEVADCLLNYLVWGDPAKPPLVLVHGGAAHAMWWSVLAPELSRHYYIVAPDLSGHGDSGRRETYPLEVWADEIMGVIAHAGCIGPPVRSATAWEGWSASWRQRCTVTD